MLAGANLFQLLELLLQQFQLDEEQNNHHPNINLKIKINHLRK